MDAADLSRAVWLSKYCLQEDGEAAEGHIGETWRRVAHAAASAEERPEDWAHRFESLFTQIPVEFPEQTFYQFRLAQLFTKQPDCLGIRHSVAYAKP
jgi:ribonucleotide reductase alpha subunit